LSLAHPRREFRLLMAETLDTTGAVWLTLGVARLGENDLRGWWQGYALDRTGGYVLSAMFRRTWRLAALELDVAAASKMHDELLDRPTALHLYSDRLPFRRWASSWLAEQKTATELDPLVRTLEGWTAETAAECLRAWSGSEVPRGESLGEGLLLGRMSAEELADPATVLRAARALAAAYIDQTETLRPPYFDLAR
jgi:hypothetical protein